MTPSHYRKFLMAQGTSLAYLAALGMFSEKTDGR